MSSLLLAVAVFGPVIGSVIVLVVRPIGLAAGRVLAVSCGISAVAALAVVVVSATHDDGRVGEVAWIALRTDRATSLLLAMAMATGVVVASFARRNVDLDPRAARFFALLGALVTGSALVVVPGAAWVLAIGWLMSGWALVGLIGHRSERKESQRAQRRVVRALVAGDLAVIAAIVLVWSVAGVRATADVAATLADLRDASIAGVSVADLVAVLLVIAGASRSALVPFHRWLVATLAAPTPVSAIVHAGFVSGAGLLFIRFAPLLAGSTVAMHLAFTLAVLTVIVATGAGSVRVDVKGKLAWSTVGQMAFMVLQCSVGAFSSAVFHIVGHGMYKASLFLGAGDAVSAGLRTSRRAAPAPIAPLAARRVITTVVPAIAVAGGFVLIGPDTSDGGLVLIAVFAWITGVHGLWGWLARGPMSTLAATVAGTIVCFAAVFGYLGGLRLVEIFVHPSFESIDLSSAVAAPTLIVTLVVLAAAALVVRSSRRLDAIGQNLSDFLVRTAHPSLSSGIVSGVARDVQRLSTAAAGGDAEGDAAGRAGRDAGDVESAIRDHRAASIRNSQIRADVARAAAVTAPLWPLTSVVAVNPLGGLESLGFAEAARIARHQFGGRTHLGLDDFRIGHAAGATTAQDLRWAVQTRHFEACSLPPIQMASRAIPVDEVIVADLLYGPVIEEPLLARTALERHEGRSGPVGALIDETIFHAAGRLVCGPSTNCNDDAPTLMSLWQRDALRVGGLRRHLDAAAVEWLLSLGDDPAAIISRSFELTAVVDGDRITEMQGHLACLQGWAGYAKWRSDWAASDEVRPAIAPIDLVAARSALEAAVLFGSDRSDRIDCSDRGAAGLGSSERRERGAGEAGAVGRRSRVVAVAAALGVDDPTDEESDAIDSVLADLDPADRHDTWLAAQEHHSDTRLLTVLDRPDPGPPQRVAEAQLSFCIDVRSEGLRRHLEAIGPYDTIGFAGFFGVAMTVRRVEWEHAEPRCPVLVAPSVHAVEHARPHGEDAVEQARRTDRRTAGASAAATTAKYGNGSPFVLAEAAGWLTGPAAAARTLLPTVRRTRPELPTVMELRSGGESPSDVEQWVYTAEAVLNTMGLTTGFAPLVVLCGHASTNVNNPHATALDCGACAGASGRDNARAVALLLNDGAIRAGLIERGIEIPAGTHFVAGLHDTVSDRVEIIDRDVVPAEHGERLDQLIVDLDVAARRQSSDRARVLPGRSATVQRRGSDWAQIRPEWGLAGNASFIIGPRSITAGLDLGGRAFLHTYDADADPSGKVLETIMTAPLVVGHWISAQYYFSTVDPEVFGAGDKLLHNVVGNTGVITGEGGDLRVGLPLQSTHVGTERHHQPVRLLAVVQAPLERIERIIGENPILSTLLGGSWMRIAGRSHPHERWSIRTPAGTWITEPRSMDVEAADAQRNDHQHADDRRVDGQDVDGQDVDESNTQDQMMKTQRMENR